MAGAVVDRAGIAAELTRVRLDLRGLVERAEPADFERRSNATRWNNEQLLFHMVFGFMVVSRLIPLVKIVDKLPPQVGSGYAALLNAGASPFHVVNYAGTCAAATVFNRRRVSAQCDRVIHRLQRKLAGEAERDFARGMCFPVRWDPYFTHYMRLEDVYRYPTKHYDFHRRQLTFD